MDEAGFTSEATINEAFFPGWVVGHTIGMLVSTISNRNPNQLFTRILELSNHPLVAVHMFKLVCVECRRRNPDLSRPCVHNLHYVPQHLANEKWEFVMELWKSNPTLQRTEMLCDFIASDDVAFSPRQVDDFISNNFTAHWPPDARDWLPLVGDAVFVACDPNGGGASRFAIKSVIVRRGCGTLVVGVENSPIEHPVATGAAALISHVDRLAAVYPFVRRSLIVLLLESNNLVAEAMWPQIAQNTSYDWRLVWQGRALGVHTNTATKNAMVHQLQSLLQDRLVALAPPSRLVSEMDPEQVTGELRRQMVAFKRHTKLIHNGTAVSVTYSGKDTGPDDLVMTLCIATLYSGQYIRMQKEPAPGTVILSSSSS